MATGTRDDIREGLQRAGVVAVIRTDSPDPIPELAAALVRGGVTALEVTLTVPRAVDVIRELVRTFGDRALIGAGTVLRVSQGEEVIAAGAQFLVSPIGCVPLVAVAHRSGRAVMLGAYTPTEAQAVHEAGADFVKIFPCDLLGAPYIKALLAPLPHLCIVPTGGVDLKTAPELIRAGCKAVGVGSTLISKELVRDRRWADLEALASQFKSVVEAARPKR